MSVQPIVRVSRAAAHNIQDEHASKENGTDSDSDVERREISLTGYYRIDSLVRPVFSEESVHFRDPGTNLVNKTTSLQ